MLMRFNIIDPTSKSLRWENMEESFWNELYNVFEDYKAYAQSDLDKLSVARLLDQMFYEESEYKRLLIVDPDTAIALRRMYVFYRLRATKFGEFLYQYDEIVRDIEDHFKAQGKEISPLTAYSTRF